MKTDPAGRIARAAGMIGFCALLSRDHGGGPRHGGGLSFSACCSFDPESPLRRIPLKIILALILPYSPPFVAHGDSARFGCWPHRLAGRRAQLAYAWNGFLSNAGRRDSHSSGVGFRNSRAGIRIVEALLRWAKDRFPGKIA